MQDYIEEKYYLVKLDANEFAGESLWRINEDPFGTDYAEVRDSLDWEPRSRWEFWDVEETLFVPVSPTILDVWVSMYPMPRTKVLEYML